MVSQWNRLCANCIGAFSFHNCLQIVLTGSVHSSLESSRIQFTPSGWTRRDESDAVNLALDILAVSYTHLTLPTIYSV